MIKYFDGTVFNTNADAIVNTVNCDGFMGAGLALEFALRYPKMFNDYSDKCKKNLIKVCVLDSYKEADTIIINFPTKDSFKFPSNIKWIEEGLRNFRDTYKLYAIKSIAFPKLGCSNGGLQWSVVKTLMEKYLSDLDIIVYICLDETREAQGKELQMLQEFNKINLIELSKIVKLTTKQIGILENKRPYNRFWQIGKTPGIGATTYKNLFRQFYNNNSTQMKLF